MFNEKEVDQKVAHCPATANHCFRESVRQVNSAFNSSMCSDFQNSAFSPREASQAKGSQTRFELEQELGHIFDCLECHLVSLTIDGLTRCFITCSFIDSTRTFELKNAFGSQNFSPSSLVCSAARPPRQWEHPRRWACVGEIWARLLTLPAVSKNIAFDNSFWVRTFVSFLDRSARPPKQSNFAKNGYKNQSLGKRGSNGLIP